MTSSVAPEIFSLKLKYPSSQIFPLLLSSLVLLYFQRTLFLLSSYFTLFKRFSWSKRKRRWKQTKVNYNAFKEYSTFSFRKYWTRGICTLNLECPIFLSQILYCSFRALPIIKSQHSVQQNALYCSQIFYTLSRWTLLHVSIPYGIIISESH
jgi:hypothetical protein